MITLRQGIQAILLSVLVFSTLVCGYHVAFAAPVPNEPPGCANDTCKQVAYIWYCFDQTGVRWEQTDCIWCTGAAGRCENGTKASCEEDKSTPLFRAAYDPKEVCYCKNNPGTPFPSVQATGDYTGKFTDAGRNRWICK